ncbi:hypothetical protein QBC32DRAFT_379962 [Pseudoneurospora amorphoporcata]|uniref:TM2 domain-containing protein n=1 Tax=Pseudoneurospora amorphoporcata TaxID=241081 RepID=A0AAN6NS67_9PEZI|nr:hypothetical protein QBC32DRAFT_379962 [Pseudoneurospora amorphoporcata]
MAQSSPLPVDIKKYHNMEKGSSPLITTRAPWRRLLNSVHVPRRLKTLWPFLLLFHLLSAIFIIALIVFIRNTATERYGTADGDNIDLILSSFPFPPPTTPAYPFHPVDLHDRASNLAKRWGHFDRLPTSPKCYRQERTAALISLFGGGILGADQLYAGNLRIGLTRLLLHVWAWCSVTVAGCVLKVRDDRSTAVLVICGIVWFLGGLTEGGVWIWAVVDLVRWIIGGYYGTKGCPV